MDKELERKVREEAKEYAETTGHASHAYVHNFGIYELTEFAKKILEKYGAEGGT